MEKKVKVIFSMVGYLGLLTIALFVAAEATRRKASQIQFTSSSTWIYPCSPAFGLELIAAVSLTVAQSIIPIAAGCFCCGLGSHQSNCDRTWAVILFILSWVGFVAVFLRLLSDAAPLRLLSDAAPHGHHGNKTMYFGTHRCYFVKGGVFGHAAASSFSAVICGIVCLVFASKRISNEAGIAKVHPQGSTPLPQHPPA